MAKKDKVVAASPELGKVRVQTKEMIFDVDKFVDGQLAFEKNVVYDIPLASVDRWIKRGGRIVEEVIVMESENPFFQEQSVPDDLKL